MKKKLALMAAIATLAAAPAFADTGNAEKWFSMLDKNNDGTISHEENDAFSREKWAQADTNKDGKLSKDEILAARQQDNMAEPQSKVDRMFAKADTNKDGYISSDEQQAMKVSMWKSSDANGDGIITKDEFMSAKQRAASNQKDHKADKPQLD